MPQELEIWYLFPALRRELSKEMIKLNLKQADIARRLGTTRAAVSQYLKSKRAQKIKFDIKTKKAIKETAKQLISEDKSLIFHMQKLLHIAKQNKVLCRLHQLEVKDHDKNCEVCMR